MVMNDDVSTSEVRRGYRRPELHQYGAMRDVTRGGSAGTPEAQAGGNPNKAKS
jgi:hypothetical protein